MEVMEMPSSNFVNSLKHAYILQMLDAFAPVTTAELLFCYSWRALSLKDLFTDESITHFFRNSISGLKIKRSFNIENNTFYLVLPKYRYSWELQVAVCMNYLFIV